MVKNLFKRKKDQTTEQRILEAARKVFQQKGLAGARMQDIADEAGINKALLHYYFKNKDKLFEVIFTDAFTRFMPRVNSIIESDLGLFEKIEHFTANYIDMAIENPYVPAFVLGEMNRHPDTFFQKIWGGHPPRPEVFVRQVEEEKQKGTIRDISPVQLIMHMMSLCVFPFVGKPMFQLVMHLDELQYRNLMQQRKKEVADFIINSIKK